MTGSSLRVLLLSPGGSGDHWDGPGTAARALFRSAPLSDVTVDLLHGSPLQDAEADPYRRIVRAGEVGRRSATIAFLFRAGRWIRQHASEYDLVYAVNAFEPTVRPAAAARRGGLPVVLKVAQHRFDLADKPGLATLVGNPRRRRREIRRFSAVVAISSEIEDELLEYDVPPDRVRRIPNGVDVGHFRPARPGEKAALREELGWPAALTVLCVGALIPRKGQLRLIRAFAARRPEVPPLHLVLAGPRPDDAYFAAVQEEVAALGVGEQVTFADFRPDPATWYRASDVFVLMSENEGLANVMLEAMSSGLPVITSATSGAKDLVVDGDNGAIVVDDDELVGALVRYTGDADLRSVHGTRSRQRAEQQFSVDSVGRQYRRLFEELARADSDS